MSGLREREREKERDVGGGIEALSAAAAAIDFYCFFSFHLKFVIFLSQKGN